MIAQALPPTLALVVASFALFLVAGEFIAAKIGLSGICRSLIQQGVAARGFRIRVIGVLAAVSLTSTIVTLTVAYWQPEIAHLIKIADAAITEVFLIGVVLGVTLDLPVQDNKAHRSSSSLS